MKKKISALLTLLLLLGVLFTGGFDQLSTEAPETVTDSAGFSEEVINEELLNDEVIAEDGWYYSAQDVALYIHIYGHLPDNFITKSEAASLGWEGGSVEPYAPGYAIGGDLFGNREGLLPEEKGRYYYECDIDTLGTKNRGAHRIVFSNDGLIYYTQDHYESFEQLYGEE